MRVTTTHHAFNPSSLLAVFSSSATQYNEYERIREKMRLGKEMKRTMDRLQPDRYLFITLELLKFFLPRRLIDEDTFDC